MYQAAGDAETLPFLGRTRSINSIVLLSNGISFALQVVIFLILGSFADFGTWRPNILIVLSIIAFGIGFGWLGVHTADDWHIGVGLYIVGLIAYQTTGKIIMYGRPGTLLRSFCSHILDGSLPWPGKEHQRVANKS